MMIKKQPFSIPSLAVISCRTNGRRVTIPDPRGKKSLSKINTDHEETDILQFYNSLLYSQYLSTY